MNRLASYAEGHWHVPPDEGTVVRDAVTGEPVAAVSSTGLDFGAMAAYARRAGGPALRRLTFPERAAALTALARYLDARKDAYYELSYATGATRRDAAVDVEGGIGTLFVFGSKGRKELPEGHLYVDGGVERIGKGGTFVGRHVYTPLRGVAVHINAFNFPVWGMLEKLAPAVLAGVPAIVKPAGQTAYLTAAVFRDVVESGCLPEGAVQLVCGGVGDLLDHLDGQDAVAFTGSAATAATLRRHAAVAVGGTRFNAETDSLNCAILGPDAAPGSPEFDLFVDEVVREMTVKAGQKCTAIRRAFVPRRRVDAAAEAITARLCEVTVGNPRNDRVTMGALASLRQRAEVRAAIRALAAGAEVVYGGAGDVDPVDADAAQGAFVAPVLLYSADNRRPEPHTIEAFGPVATLLPYDDADEAVDLAALGEGSLVGSIVSHDEDFVREVVLGVAAYHGRLLVLDRDCAPESTGHGAPLPHLVHGGPGRAGGGEELGGVRGVLHYMQRTALQGSPATVAAVIDGGPAR